MIVHETYRVTWKIGDTTHSLRVSQPDVERFLAVLLFNHAKTIACEQELSPFTTGTTGWVAPISAGT